jgi:hypothetical protein
MVMLVLMAIVGAVLGACVRPRLIAVPLAIGVAEGCRGLIDLVAPTAVDNISAPFWAKAALGVAEDPLSGYLPLLAVSAGAALLTALLTLLIDRAPPRPASLAEATAVQRRVRKGRYVRAANMIEERPAQAKAEERQKALLGL